MTTTAKPKRLSPEERLARLESQRDDFQAKLAEQRRVVARRAAQAHDHRLRQFGELVVELLGADATLDDVRGRLIASAVPGPAVEPAAAWC